MLSRWSVAATAGFVIVSLAGCAAILGSSPAPASPPLSLPGATPSSAPVASSQPSAAPASPAPAASPSATAPTGTVEVVDPAQAAALVLAADPRFAQVSLLTQDLVGASAWYEVNPALPGGYSVTVTLGSGDCQAGCINRHSWHYTVSSDGKVALVSESGDVVQYLPPSAAPGPATVAVTAQAGPTCPAERYPPSSACAPRAVAGAQVLVHLPAGDVVAQATTDAGGDASVQLPAGAYWIEALPVAGLLGTPTAQAFSVVAGRSQDIVFDFDTGIR